MPGPSRTQRVEFTDQDRNYMIKYLAKYTVDPQGRSGNEIWKRLVENRKRKWNWADRHTWQSWRNHYAKDKDWFDRKIRRYQTKHPELEPLSFSPRNDIYAPSTQEGKHARVPFNDDDDQHLAQFLAEHSVSREGRLGNRLYEALMENGDGERPWAARHTMHSWRGRYSNNRDTFDKYILQYQRDHSPIAVLETPAGARKSRRKEKARAEEDESIPEVAEEEDGAEDAEQGSGNSKKRRTRTSDGHGSRKTAKRRRVEPHEDERRSQPVPKEGAGDAAGQPSADAGDVDQPGSGEEEEQPKTRRRLRSKREAEGAPPLDDYAGNIFDVSESSGSETEEEDEEEARRLPPIAVRQEEEEEDGVLAEGEEEEEEVDQLAPSVSPTQKPMDVDAETRATIKREPTESRSPSPSGTPTPIILGQTSKDQLYPSLPSPDSRDEEADDFAVPGHFPATSTPVDARAAPVLSEATALAHERPASQEEQKPVISVIHLSQGPTPPASSPPADVKPTVDHNGSDAHPGPSDARDANAEAGPSNVDTTPRAANARPSKAKTYKRKPEEDIFASVITTPSIASSRDVTPTAERPRRPREPPRLADGPFNHVFTGAVGKPLNGARPTGVTDDAQSDIEEVWPPRRGRSKGKEREKEKPRSAERRPPSASAPEVKVEAQDQAAALQQMRSLPARAHHPFSQPTQDVGASQSAYSQEQQNESQHHPFSQPSQYVDTDTQGARPSQSRTRANGLEANQPFKLPKAHLERLEQELRKNGQLLRAPHERRASFATSTPIQRALRRPSDRDIPVPGASTARETISEGPSRNSDIARSVRFDASALDAKSESKDYGPSTPHVNGRRHTLSGSTEFEAPLQDDRSHIDHVLIRHSLPLLPSALHGVRSADDSFVGTASPSISFRRPLKRESLSFVQQPKPRSASAEPEPPLQISEDDESVVVHIGVETAIQTMSENHGFTPEIVRRVWGQTQSLRKTDTLLRRMREAAEKAAVQLLEGLDDANEDGDQSRAEPSTRANAPAQGAAPRRSSHKRNSSSVLRITPTEPDGDSSEYSPPKPTRAGQYLRLVKEGRQDEAIAREVSYASGASPMETPQRHAAEAGHQANGGSSREVAADRHHAFELGKHSTIAWAAGMSGQTSSRDGTMNPGLNMTDDAVKIALGKKLGRMLANVEV